MTTKSNPDAWLYEFSSIIMKNQTQVMEAKQTDLLSIVNLFNIIWLSDYELIALLNNKYWIDIKSEKWIEYFQKLYDEAINIYTQELLIDLRSPFKWHKFKSSHSIINFLKNTYTSWHTERRQIYCDLTKLMFVLSELDKYPTVNSAETDTNEFISDYIINNSNINTDVSQFMQKKEWEEYYEWKWIYTVIDENGWEKKIPFTLRFRWKTRAKVALKLLFNEEWKIDVTEACQDNIWYEFETKEIENSIYFLQLDYNIRRLSWCDITQTDYRQKPGFYNEEELKSFSNHPHLSSDFKEVIKKNFKPFKRSTGSNKYKDAKWKWPVKNRKWEETWCEWRTVIEWNKNQSWLSNSKIIDWRKKILAMIGMRWWVSENYISRIIKHIKETYNIEKSEERIHDFFIEWLIPVNIVWSNRKVYSTEKTLRRIVKFWENTPDFIARSIAKYTKKTVEEILQELVID